MGSRESGRSDGCEGGVNLVGLESVLWGLWVDAERRLKPGKGVRGRGRRRRRWIADIVGAIRDLEMFGEEGEEGESYICQEPRNPSPGSRAVTRVGISDCALYSQSLVSTNLSSRYIIHFLPTPFHPINILRWHRNHPPAAEWSACSFGGMVFVCGIPSRL